MNDYFINEKILREFREVSSPVNIKEPTPYPKKIPSNFSSKQTSNNATFKKEINDLESKFKNLEKAYNKIMKKNNDVQDEMKTLKTSNDSLSKELNIVQISNEKILGEKINLENQLEENKNYIRKLESRLVHGAKNQYLVEINNKLRKEVEDIKKFHEDKFEEYERIKKELSKKNQEIKILNKALEFRTDEIKFKGDLKSSILYDVGMVKQELDEFKEKYENELEINEQFKIENSEMNNKITELNFVKVHLTNLIVDKENKIHNLEIEKEAYEKHCQELKEERNMLREYIEKFTNEFNEYKVTFEEENKNLSENLKEAYNNLKIKEENIKDLSINSDESKKMNSSLLEKLKSLEQNLKTKINESNNLENINKDLKDYYKNSEEINKDLEKEKNSLKENVIILNRQLQNLEKENLDLMKRNKSLIISQEKFEADLVIQNQQLQNTETKLKEKIENYNIEIEKLRDEKEDLKKMMNEAITKCSMIMKEKSELEKDLNKKTLQIENLKNTNILLHKNFSIKNKEKEQLNYEEEKVIKLGESKLEENNTINLIRREKEKNKEFLEEIKKLKNNLNY